MAGKKRQTGQSSRLDYMAQRGKVPLLQPVKMPTVTAGMRDYSKLTPLAIGGGSQGSALMQPGKKPKTTL